MTPSRRRRRDARPTTAASPTATADLHAHTPAPTASSARRARRQAAAAGDPAARDHRPRQPRRATASSARRRRPAGLDARPGRRDQRPSPAASASSRGRAPHPRARGGPGRRGRSRPRCAAQRAARRARFERTVARLRELGMPIDAQVERARPDPRRRPRPAHGRAGAGRRGPRESVEDAFGRLLGYGPPGLRPAAGPRARSRRSGDPRRGRPGRRSPTSGEARPAATLLAELLAAGLQRPRDPPPLVRRRDRGRGRDVARELGLVATGGTDYHGDLGTYAEAHAALVGAARGRGGRIGARLERRRPAPATTMSDRMTTRALPDPRDRAAATGPAGAARPAAPDDARLAESARRPGRCRGSTSGRSAAR